MRTWLTVAVTGGIGMLAAPALVAGAASDTVVDPVVSTRTPVYVTAPVAHASAAPGPRTATVRGRVDVDATWASDAAVRAGVPVVAVRAYARAELMVRAEDPSCGLGWTTLAGLGYVESQHGTIGGRSLLSDGHSSAPILGPALDGSGDFAAIAASPASTQWHDDPRWDHAVGPLQFMPSTWARWSSDGDGDGVGDPNDIDDAAYAAGRYLCAGGRDLTSGTGWGAAVFSYNHSASYVDQVYSAASAYSSRTR
ncbi:lytic murein transglycosylase [Nocardioides jiangxiensis]|uniref:Lytic murein transglycosylase n=1 Tax=Nocardioides jiangxiensis TaxID=3064524 RepID=A0ABT9B6P1_9ACTN|nr:lytic murein transglycosylase [Nocardioides sp. WY-20]MDO7868803.1 lytic murein transglycosylase [Nocardioides sp. WY-20]